MKRKMNRLLSLALAVLMLASAFALLPVMAAENGDSAPNQYEEKNGDVLWSADFDDYPDYVAKNPGATTAQYLATKKLYVNTFNGSINSQNKLLASYNQWWLDGQTDDPFRELFYGIYTDSDGNKVDNYYMELDYTVVTPRDGRAYTFKGVDANNQTVTYTVASPYRGESYFNPLAGATYDFYLFKVSASGYLYTRENTGTVTFSTADSGKNSFQYFTYTKKVGNTTVATKQPITEEVWNTMREECGTSVSSSTKTDVCEAITFDRVHKSGTNFYQMEVGKEYTIRVKMSVDSSNNVTATTYVRPAGSDEPFSKVGSCSYTYNGTTSKAIRVSENVHQYTLDNLKFVNHGACVGEHDFPVVNKTVVDSDGVDTYNEMNCLKCGAIYYENCATNTIVQSFMLVVTMPLGGISGGTQCILSYNYGACNCERVTKAHNFIRWLCAGYNTFMFAMVYLAGPLFISLFTKDQELAAQAFRAIKICTLAIIPLGIQYAIIDGLTGMGQVQLSLPLSFWRKTVYFVSIFLLPQIFGAGAVFFAEPISDILGPVVSIFVCRKYLPKVLRSREENVALSPRH